MKWMRIFSNNLLVCICVLVLLFAGWWKKYAWMIVVYVCNDSVNVYSWLMNIQWIQTRKSTIEFTPLHENHVIELCGLNYAWEDGENLNMMCRVGVKTGKLHSNLDLKLVGSFWEWKVTKIYYWLSLSGWRMLYLAKT